jgi:Flp pilus assembly protein CpaB
MGKNIKLVRYGLLSAILLTGVFFWGPWGRIDPSSAGGADQVPVLVADSYIPVFTVVKEKMVTVRNFPRLYAPPASLHTMNELVGDNNQGLYSSAVPIPEGQPLTRTILDEIGKSHGMASTLPIGKAAVSFSADPVRGVGGWVEPGDTIAVFETSRDSGPKNMSHITKLLFSSLSVLAVDKNRLGLLPPDAAKNDSIENPEPRPVVITVLVNPVEAARLVEAREQMHLSVALRPLADDTPWATP